jgi:phage-related protein (TIGR01555 family)
MELHPASLKRDGPLPWRINPELNVAEVLLEDITDAIARETRNDGALVNVLTRMGTTSDRSTHTAAAIPQLLQQEDLNRLYVNSWLCRRIVDLVPSECTRAGWELTLGKETTQVQRERFQRLLADGERLGIRQAIREGLRLARFQGGAVVVMLADDGLPPVEPLDHKRLRRIKGLYPMDCRRIWPAPGWSGVGTPTLYEFMVNSDEDLQRQGLDAFATVPIHASRLLRFEGDPVPYDYRGHVNWWGLSVIQSVWEVFKRYETGQKSASDILLDFSFWVHKIKGLAGMIAAGNEENIQKRLEINAMTRSVLGGMVLDADGEELVFLTRSVAGVHDILNELKGEVQGACRIPHTKLWGTSPSGLGADGRSEDASFAQEVAQWQQDHIDRPLRQFYEALAHCQDSKARMELPDEWKVDFISTFVLNDKEQADLRASVTQSDVSLISAKVLQPHEVAMARFGGPEWTMETNLLDREKDGKIKEPAQGPLETTFGGDLAGSSPLRSESEAGNQELSGPENLQGATSPQTEQTPREDSNASGCCEPCDAAEAQGKKRPCDEPSGEATEEEDSAPVAETMHRTQAVAIALSIAGQSRPRAGRGRRPGVRNDGTRVEGHQVVCGIPLLMRSDGTASLLGPYGESTPFEAAVGFDRQGVWEVVSTTTGQWCAVVGVEHRDAVEAAAGANTRVRPLDSVDLVAMGIRCDAYGQ